MGWLDKYKAWVRQHPYVVGCFDWVVPVVAWNPNRLHGNEFTFESYHAAAGLLAVWHQHILQEQQALRRPNQQLWLEMLETVQTLIELRAMYLEKLGKMSRYDPLAVLEFVKCCIKMMLWSQCSCHLFLRNPAPEDVAHVESEEGVREVLAAFQRLRSKYSNTSEFTKAATWDPRRLVPSNLPLGNLLATAARCFLPRSTAVSVTTPPATASQDAAQPGCSCSAGCRSSGSPAPLQSSPTGSQDASCTHHSLNTASSEITPGSPFGSPVQSEALLHNLDTNSTCKCNCHKGMTSNDLSTSHLCQPSSSATKPAQPFLSGEGIGLPLKNNSQGLLHNDQGHSLLPAPDTEAQLRMAMNLIWLGELLHIWRPLGYVLLLKRHGRQSWKPWCGSLAWDLLSMYFQQRGKQMMDKATGVQSTSRGTSLLSLALLRGLSSPSWSAGEHVEVLERRKALALYLLRSPALETVVLGPLEGIRRRTQRIPGLSFLTNYCVDLLETYTQYYTYTSGS